MSRNSRGRPDKKKRRERRVRREHHVRDAWAHTPGSGAKTLFDLDIDLGELPVAMQDERVMRRIALVTGQRIFRQPADVVDALAKLGFTPADGSGRITEALGRAHPLEVAQDTAFAALASRDPHVTSLLVQLALQIDPHCVDAAALHALYVESEEEATIVGLERIVAAAECALGGHSFIVGCSGRLWDDVLARPYLRARRFLGDVLLVAGRRRDAEAHFTELLALDVGDPLEIRDAVLGFALERRDVQRAGELAASCRNSDSPVATWARALERWWNGDLADAARLVRRGREESPLVVRALMEPSSSSRGKPVLRFEMDSVPSPHRAQAMFVELRIGPAWRSHTDALAWLADGAHATSEEQRQVACASFASPVSTLLSIGDEGLQADWVDYDVRFGLSSQDVSELLRMATDPAMNDIEEADPRSRAASHAWRSLATLRATEAIEPLLDFHVLRLGHDRLFAELQALLARIGSAAVQPLVAVIKDVARAPLLRGLACESLAHLAGEDALLRERACRVIAAELELCQRNEPDLNAWLILGLVQLRGTAHAPVIRRAFAGERVTLSIAGDWECVAAELGVDA